MPVFDSLETLKTRRRGIRRRRFLSVILAGAAAWFGYRWWRQLPQQLAQRATDYITRNSAFYTVSIHSRYPRVDPSTWRLTLKTGQDELRWSLDELRAMESKEVTKTLACISNPVGGTAVGNAVWRGFPLADLLPSRVLSEESLRVVFRGLDGFHSSVPIEVARDPGAYLVHSMNGEPLSREHGFPLRVFLPGKFGMKQPRWLDEIEVTTDRARGYWESRGWSEAADMHLSARIDSAKSGPDGVWRIQGIAYAGAPAVGGVEVSLDEGPWQPAELTTPALPDAWINWSWLSQIAPGEHLLAARVFDVEGNRQIETFSGSFPSGATGIHRVRLEIPPGRA